MNIMNRSIPVTPESALKFYSDVKNSKEADEIGVKFILPNAALFDAEHVKVFLEIVQSNEHILNAKFTPAIVAHVYHVTRAYLLKTHNLWADFINMLSFKYEFGQGLNCFYHPIYQEMVEMAPTEKNLQHLTMRY